MPDGSGYLPEIEPPPASAKPDPFLRVREVMASTGLGRSSIYRRISAGTFPAPKQIGGGQVRWRFSEVEGWKDAKPSAEPKPPAVGGQAGETPPAAPRRPGRPGRPGRG